MKDALTFSLPRTYFIEVIQHSWVEEKQLIKVYSIQLMENKRNPSISASPCQFAQNYRANTIWHEKAEPLTLVEKTLPHYFYMGGVEGEYGYMTRLPPLQSQWLSSSNDAVAETGPFVPQDSIVPNWTHHPLGLKRPKSAVNSPSIISYEKYPFLLEMYVPEPTNIPIEKTNHRGEIDLEVPLWPTPSENDIIHLPRGKCEVDWDLCRLHVYGLPF